jgi:hypothetical protein
VSSAALPKLKKQDCQTGAGKDDRKPENPWVSSPAGRPCPRLMKYNPGGALRLRLCRYPESLAA